jgi:hypothetical protein
VRCVPGSSKGPTGHRHNDQLSFELTVDGEDICVDWGTGVYTADDSVRNRYRSTAYHSTAFPPGREQNRILEGSRGAFVLRDRTDARCIEVGASLFIGEHRGFGVLHRREIRLIEDAIIIEDCLDAPGGFDLALTLAEGVTLDSGDSDAADVVKLGHGKVEITIDSTMVGKPTIKPGAPSSGYGIFGEALALHFTNIHGNSVMKIRYEHSEGRQP